MIHQTTAGRSDLIPRTREHLRMSEKALPLLAHVKKSSRKTVDPMSEEFTARRRPPRHLVVCYWISRVHRKAKDKATAEGMCIFSCRIGTGPVEGSVQFSITPISRMSWQRIAWHSANHELRCARYGNMKC